MGCRKTGSPFRVRYRITKTPTKDDDLNFTNEPTLQEEVSPKPTTDQEPVVSLHIPDFPTEHMPSMRKEDDSVSTFHQGQTINLADYPDNEEEEGRKVSSTKPDPLVGILQTSRPHDVDAVLKNFYLGLCLTNIVLRDRTIGNG